MIVLKHVWGLVASIAFLLLGIWMSQNLWSGDFWYPSIWMFLLFGVIGIIGNAAMLIPPLWKWRSARKRQDQVRGGSAGKPLKNNMRRLIFWTVIWIVVNAAAIFMGTGNASLLSILADWRLWPYLVIGFYEQPILHPLRWISFIAGIMAFIALIGVLRSIKRPKTILTQQKNTATKQSQSKYEDEDLGGFKK